MLKLKTGDSVLVISGKDKGNKSQITKLFPKTSQAQVKGVNTVTKHQKKSSENPSGKIVEKDMPVHVSNLMLADPKDGKPTRVGFKVDTEGVKRRYAKRSGQII